MKKLRKNVILLILIYGFVGILIAILQYKKINDLQIPFRIFINLLLPFWLYKNLSKSEFTKIKLFTLSIYLNTIASIMFVYTFNFMNVFIGVILYLFYRIFLFLYFQKHVNIRDQNFINQCLVLVPSVLSLWFCSKYLIGFIPDQIVPFSIIIIFIDSLFLGISFFYVGNKNLKILFIIGAMFQFASALLVGKNLYYGNLIGDKLPGLILSQLSKILFTLVIFYQVSEKEQSEE